MTFPQSPPRFSAPKQSGARQEPLRHGIFDTSKRVICDGDGQPIPTCWEKTYGKTLKTPYEKPMKSQFEVGWHMLKPLDNVGICWTHCKTPPNIRFLMIVRERNRRKQWWCLPDQKGAGFPVKNIIPSEASLGTNHEWLQQLVLWNCSWSSPLGESWHSKPPQPTININ